MTRDLTPPDERPLWQRPWPLMGGALAAAILADGLSLVAPDWVLLRVVLVLAALLGLGVAVQRRLSAGLGDLDERLGASGLLAVAAVVVLFARDALDRDWDSAILLLGLGVGVALVGAALVLLPPRGRRVGVSVLVVVHFAGILSAVTSIQGPGGSPPPWLASHLWTSVYRPYLQFVHLTNAYHFYSPEPGPPCQLWFRVEYADGSSRWIIVPRREDFATSVEYQRRLALTESSNQLMPLRAWPIFAALHEQRKEAGKKYDPAIPEPAALAMPLYAPYQEFALPPQLQYREPNPYSKMVISAYARHVARTSPHPVKPELEVVGVKVYRVTQQIISPKRLGSGVDPHDPVLHQPFYQGEFDRDGKMKDPNDPFLYWYLPITKGRPVSALDGTVWKRDPYLHWYLPIAPGHRASPAHEAVWRAPGAAAGVAAAASTGAAPLSLGEGIRIWVEWPGHGPYDVLDFRKLHAGDKLVEEHE